MNNYACFIIGFAAVLLTLHGRAAEFIQFYLKPSLAVCPMPEWAVQGVKPCRSFDRGILMAEAKAVGDVAQRTISSADSPSDDGSAEKGVLAASTSMADEKRLEPVPLIDKAVFTLSIMKWMLSLSGPQVLHVIHVIMDVICYGVEPDLTQISPKHQPSFTAILDQIASLSKQYCQAIETKTSTKTSAFKARNSPRNSSGSNSGAHASALSSEDPLNLNKELKEKLIQLFFYNFFPFNEIQYFEDYLRNHPEECQSEEQIMRRATKWYCNTPNDQRPWADKPLTRQFINEVKKSTPLNYYRAWRGIISVEQKEGVLIIYCKQNYYSEMTRLLQDLKVWNMDIRCEVAS